MLYFLNKYFSLTSFMVCLLLFNTYFVNAIDLTRVGHVSVQISAISDGAARPHQYPSVVVYDDGSVVALNMWYGPTLFYFHPDNNSLTPEAFSFPHQFSGNEDNSRIKLRAHKGLSDADSYYFWHVVGYEEIDDDNGMVARDSAVFSSKPIKLPNNSLPTRKAMVLNYGSDASNPNIGPVDGGLDYDEANNLLFVTMDRADISENNTAFQIITFDPITGDFGARQEVPLPDPSQSKQLFSFIEANATYGVVMTAATNHWETNGDILYLAQYEVNGSGTVAVSNFQHLSGSQLFLSGSSGDSSHYPHWMQSAELIEHNGDLYAIVASSYHHNNRLGNDQSHGLYIFNLGQVGSSYNLTSPIAKVKTQYAVDDVQIIGGDLVVSSYGLYVYDLNQILNTNGINNLIPDVAYSLPYHTYEFDTATINSEDYLFLASGAKGIDVFQLTHAGTEVHSSPINDTVFSIDINGEEAVQLFKSGSGLKHMGAPVINNAGDIAFWAVSDTHHELIIRKKLNQPFEIVASTLNGLVNLSRPSINAAAVVAFRATKDNQSVALYSYDNSLIEAYSQQPLDVLISHPEIDNIGNLVFMKQLHSGHRTVSRIQNSLASDIYTESSELFYSLYAENGFDFDVSPDGKISFLTYLNGSNLKSWEPGGMVTNLYAHNYLSNMRWQSTEYLAVRAFVAENTYLNRVSALGDELIVADRHGNYNGHIFGSFDHMVANNQGNVVFTAPKFVTGTLDDDEMGNWLHKYQSDAPNLPGAQLKTSDQINNETVRNIYYSDGLNNNDAIVFNALLENNLGVTQAIMAINYAEELDDLIYENSFE